MIRAALLAMALIAASCAWAQKDAADPLAEANALYRDGKPAQAAVAYQEALASGLDGPRVHYNLANALYRSDEIGEAIAHYQAALVFAPRDGDIRANLDRALGDRPAGRPAPSASWLHAAAVRIVRTFTLSEFAVAAALAWWGTAATVSVLLLRERKRRLIRTVAITLGALTLLFSGFAIARWWAWHATERAVVATETAQLRTGPGESFEVALPVQEGWMLRVLRRDADWAEVVGEGGVVGWLPGSSLEMVRGETAEAPPDA
jgi:tetratricopeptide (TPR) repeat protein